MFLIQASLLVTAAVFTLGYHVNVDDVGIYDGKPIPLIDAQFIVSVRVGAILICAGSIIDDQFILTTAHCVPQEPAEYTIHTRTNKRYDEGDVYEVDKIIKHEKFNNSEGDYDIALVKLTKKINFNRGYLKKIALPSSNLTLPEYANLNIYGWGSTEYGSLSNYLLKVGVPTMAVSECKKTYGNIITPRMICTGQRHKGFCNGDSGDPALYNNVQVGIAAFCFDPCTMYPQVFTYLPPLRSWIDEKLAENRCAC